MGFCTKCGYELKDDAPNFCPKCGTFLGKAFLNNQASKPADTNNESKIYNKKPPRSKAFPITAGLLSFLLIAIGAAFFLYHLNMTDRLDAQIQQTQYYSQELDSTKTALENASSQLIDANNQLEYANTQLAETRNDLESIQDQLAVTQEELVASQDEAETAKTDLYNATVKLTIAENKLASAEENLTSTQESLELYMSTLNGLGIYLFPSNFCFDVKLADNPEATDPTWAALLSFLSQDKTEEHAYIADVYDCSQFSRDLHNNAEAQGIRAAEVQVWFEDQWVGHALNAFLTTDLGIVYIDCTDSPDRVARVKVGKTIRAVDVKWYSFDLNNIRNDPWWDRLNQYYYMGDSPYNQWIVSGINIYW